MKIRLFDNWKTTILGLVILVYVGVLMYQGKVNLNDLTQSVQGIGGWLISAGLLVRAKDSILGANNTVKDE